MSLAEEVSRFLDEDNPKLEKRRKVFLQWITDIQLELKNYAQRKLLATSDDEKEAKKLVAELDRIWDRVESLNFAGGREH